MAGFKLRSWIIYMRFSAIQRMPIRQSVIKYSLITERVSQSVSRSEGRSGGRSLGRSVSQSVRRSLSSLPLSQQVCL